ncbi:MAG: C-terminal binding protein [Chloroflexota bacterium]
MTFKVVLTSRVLSRRDIEDFLPLLGPGGEVMTIPANTEDELIAAAQDADAVITLMQPYTRRVIAQLAKCRLIFNAGTGYEGIDIKAATEQGICVASPADYCMDEVAEHAVALLLASARKITRLDRAVRAGKWDAFEKREIRNKILPPVFQLKGKTVGLIGLGRIGRNVAPKVKGFGMKVIAYDPYLPPEVFRQVDVTPVTLDELLEKSDFVSIQAAFTEGSEHLIGREQLRKMKPTAYLINVGRGTFVDEAALAEALAEGVIAGAGLDVVTAEPEGISPDNPLLQQENVIITAHSAYYSEESTAKYKQRIYDAAVKVSRGGLPEFLLNPDVKEKYAQKWRA